MCPIMFPGQGTTLWQVTPLGNEEQWVLRNCFIPAPDSLTFPLLQHLGSTWATYEALHNCPPPIIRPMNQPLRVGLRTTAQMGRGCDERETWFGVGRFGFEPWLLTVTWNKLFFKAYLSSFFIWNKWLHK